ncbi:LysR family transcriptional regulator [Arthrobacter sp. MYb211]|uniref:LysR substrate-binding domain-containing protein n=1 Tax=unclassified Arthrobacter TaxID=235627 RepID=UPI000CFB45A8|nr:MULTISPECIES: LysR substrate-binding domain-containing protein [unclassified Arthrobacter]PRA00923.1 LysR family transcriptional regulator [Arthrobacter sp. MYb229]PRA10869.1 LysR family transcriptional regulator [Arthrobacter sp. MYb221]PRB48858.1 LysR family transcriptional regulator [Arthrobacter sp. MYb216]PRC06930.1 LysR family transcriptional regulator [Arthrobacter sp. MYb211]
MPKFTLRHLEIIAELPEHATLGSAASELRISESALSQSITAIEKIAGEPLCLRRKAHGVSMTASGEYFASMARKIIAQVDELQATFPHQEGKLRGPVRFGCFASLSPHVVPALLEGFPRVHPELDVSVRVGTHEELIPALNSGDLDVAFVYDLLLPQEMNKQVIYETEMQVVLHPEHPLARLERPLELSDLVTEPLIMYQSVPSTEYTMQLFAARGLVPKITASVPQMILVNAMVGRGLGYGLLMSRPNNAELSLEGRKLAIRRLNPPNYPSAVVAIWPRKAQLSARVLALIDFAITAMNESWQRAQPENQSSAGN